ncbi:aromatic motif membrane protein [Mycoplasma sp. 1654_15]|uniref:aromatic motif membrane protein n=1 Tax=Mycoplasma sp. 1654_15 TaxID=2725994 RepID=UPI001449D1A2|nr:aromatic motif membrane protein [Mycoplasma sp. 1654_15]QJB70938.1 hypothetical protein HF996_00135 [Mycoplasma sp. 1654_15]
MKNKKIFMIFSSIFPISLLISCSSSSVSTTDLKQFKQEYKNQTFKQQKEENWRQFLENSVVQNLLKLAYPNEEDRNKYIGLQKEIDSEKQTKKLREDYFYYSYIRTETAAFDKDSTPVFYTKSRDNIFELIRNDWLWFLYYINNIYFIKSLKSLDLFQKTGEEFTEDIRASNTSSSQFYKPKNNFFTNMIYEEVNNNFDETSTIINSVTYFKEYKILFTNEDNFIFDLTVRHIYDPSKTKVIDSKITFSPWLKIFPDYLNGKKTDFNLKQYSFITLHFGAGNTLKIARLDKPIYEESLGGDPIDFSIIDFDFDKSK